MLTLLRAGEALPVAEQVAPDCRILVSRVQQCHQAEYPFNLREPMPRLRRLVEDEEPVLEELYQKAVLDLAIDYDKQPVLLPAEAEYQWAQLLA